MQQLFACINFNHLFALTSYVARYDQGASPICREFWPCDFEQGLRFVVNKYYYAIPVLQLTTISHTIHIPILL